MFIFPSKVDTFVRDTWPTWPFIALFFRERLFRKKKQFLARDYKGAGLFLFVRTVVYFNT